MRRRPRGGRAAAALGGVLVFTGAGLGAATTWAHAPVVTTDVRVVARDFSYSLSRTTVPVGRVRFTVVNRGDIGHDFVIAGKKTRVLGPGKSAVVLVTFTRAASIAYRCSVSGHAALGMKGALRVGKPVKGTAATPSPTTTATTPKPTTTTSTAATLKLTKIGDFARPVIVAAPRGDPSRLF